MESSDQLAQWMTLWDKASSQFAKEAADQQAKHFEKKSNNSFFTGGPPSDSWNAPGDVEDRYGWGDMIARASDHGDEMLNDHRMLREQKDDAGFKKLIKGGPNAVPSFQTNPQRFSSIGTDQGPHGGPTRVTKNWTAGDQLTELDEVKRRLEEMERKVHEADVLRNSRAKLESELKGLRERLHNLSEKLQSRPEEDVT